MTTVRAALSGLAAGLVALSLAGPVGAQDAALVEKGQALAKKHNCSMCHAVAGKGGKISKPLDGVGDRYDEAGLRRVLTDPQKEFPNAKIKMPKVVWADGDVDAMIAYLQTLKGGAAK